MLAVALFGAGRIGRMHATHIPAHSGYRLVRVFDIAPAAEAVAEQLDFGIVHSVEEARTGLMTI